jgi:hypothetical protein
MLQFFHVPLPTQPLHRFLLSVAFLLCRNQIIEGLRVQQDECASKGFPGEIIFPIYFPLFRLSSDNNGQSNAPVLGAWFSLIISSRAQLLLFYDFFKRALGLDYLYFN